MSSTVLPEEINHFAKDSAHWWDENGPFKPLHKLNPERIRYIKEQVCAHFERLAEGASALDKLTILDIGCGGGLACEPLARLGAKVSGIDADAQAIAVAQEHAEKAGLKIAYENRTSEELNKKYDVVLALEVVEHVRDIGAFVRECARLVRPGGLVIFSTLNRTARSFALGIVATEYLLRWVPKGTHNWKQFVKPSELARYARKSGLEPQDVCGVFYNPVRDSFSMCAKDLDVNYFLVARSPE